MIPLTTPGTDSELIAESRAREAFAALFDRYAPMLYRYVSRQHRDEAVRYRALTRSPMESVAESPAERVAEGVSATAVRPLLASALARLSQGDRDVLLLVAWADLSYEEVAQALRIPVGTVRSRLNRARRKVREALGHTNPLRGEE